MDKRKMWKSGVETGWVSHDVHETHDFQWRFCFTIDETSLWLDDNILIFLKVIQETNRNVTHLRFDWSSCNDIILSHLLKWVTRAHFVWAFSDLPLSLMKFTQLKLCGHWKGKPIACLIWWELEKLWSYHFETLCTSNHTNTTCCFI